MGEKKNISSAKLNARTARRHDFKVSRSIASDIVCALLALLTTVLIWLSGAV